VLETETQLLTVNYRLAVFYRAATLCNQGRGAGVGRGLCTGVRVTAL
jgi:hypothetical protein